MKKVKIHIFLLILISIAIILLDKVNINDEANAINFIQNKLYEAENKLNQEVWKNDVVRLNDKNSIVFNKLMEWGIYDLNDIYHKNFFQNHSGWYWVVKKKEEVYVIKFKYKYAINNQYVSSRYASWIGISDEYVLDFDDGVKIFKDESGNFLPLKLMHFPKYRNKLIVEFNAVLYVFFWLYLLYVMFLIYPKIWWRWLVLLLVFIVRWACGVGSILSLLDESFLFDIKVYAFPVFIFKSYADWIITFGMLYIFSLSFLKKNSLWEKIINGLMMAGLIVISVYLIMYHSGISLNIADILFYDYQYRLYTILSILILFSGVFLLAYWINIIFFKGFSFREWFVIMLIVLFGLSYFIYYLQKKITTNKIEYIYDWVEHEETISLMEQLQILNSNLSNIEALNDTAYFNAIARIENNSIYLELSKRILFEDSATCHQYLNSKVNILPNKIYVDTDEFIQKNNNDIKHNTQLIYYINVMNGKYLISIFNYFLPITLRKNYPFLFKSLFQLPSGFRQFSVALYDQDQLRYNIGAFNFPEKYSNTRMIDLYNKQYSVFTKTDGKKKIMVVHPLYSIMDFISLFSFYFILIVTLIILLFIIYFGLKEKTFHLNNLSYQYKITGLVVIVLLISFCLLIYFSYRHSYNKINNDIFENLIQTSNNLNIQNDKDFFVYEKNGKINEEYKDNILFRLNLMPIFLPNNFIEKLKYHNFIFTKRHIGKYQYSSLLYFHSNNKIIEIPYFNEIPYKERELRNSIIPLFNLYTFLFLISFIFGIILSNYIIHPIQYISKSIQINSSDFPLGKINYNSNDELGELVKNYNNLIDKLLFTLEELKKEQQEKAWKLMAQQIAHDIKNTLTPLYLNAEYLNKHDIPPETKSKVIQSIIHQIQILSRIAEDFSEYAQDIQPKLEPIDLNHLIEKIIEPYSNQKNISIYFNSERENIIVQTDAYLLTRIINNLIRNSIDALDGIKNPQISITLNQIHQNIQISIKDNGCGIPNEIKNKIFEPKFSTKNSGKGLGLSIVKSIADKLNISVTFDSELNKGTIFYLKFLQ